MKNLREVKDDLLKEWLEFREETAFCEMTPQDKKYCIYFEEIAERILKNVPEKFRDRHIVQIINRVLQHVQVHYGIFYKSISICK